MVNEELRGYGNVLNALIKIGKICISTGLLFSLLKQKNK
jgi:hypothetical protein